MLNRIRRSLLLFTMLAATGASAQTYPTKPVKIIVPFPPGGSVDMVARMVGKKLADTLGQPFFIDNRAGASGNIGAEIAAKSVPDGYTIFVTSSGVLAANMHLYKKLPFDPFKDFSPVIRLVSQPNILMVHPSVQASNVKELIALAKSRPGKLTFGSAGIGTGQDIAAQQFTMMTGVDVLHVPYKGGAPALSDLLGGQINAMFETSPTAIPYVKQEKLKGLAITSAKRSKLLPDLPTVSEAGVSGYESVTWIGVVAPAGTPKAIVDLLNAELQKALGGDMGKQLAELSLDPIGGTPKDIEDAIRKDSADLAKIIKAANIQPQ
ncbi:MAG TPA: tripartite tricarboxylate transporter substrate binding protein [Burkholderiaceae bacterium]|jgi:tripartite-type tricarboxylate transporter receptor subunit TctC|nr:tripartite tricarboxylate transporter substrate binding protein [Burkholderiaceae bacterium]